MKKIILSLLVLFLLIGGFIYWAPWQGDGEQVIRRALQDQTVVAELEQLTQKYGCQEGLTDLCCDGLSYTWGAFGRGSVHYCEYTTWSGPFIDTEEKELIEIVGPEAYCNGQCLEVLLTGTELDPRCQVSDCEAYMETYEWQTFNQVAEEVYGGWSISFEYPQGYDIRGEWTPSLTILDLEHPIKTQPKLRILILNQDDDRMQSFWDSLSSHDTAEDGVTIMYATVGENELYNPPVNPVHISGFSSLDSQPYGAILIDEQPADSNALMQHVYETLHIVGVTK